MVKRLILMGAPGSGKGTWSKIICEKYGLTHLSTGDLLRKVRASETELGRKIRGFMDSGALVPDELVIEMVEKALTEGEAKDGFVFDGFPRTIAQAEALDAILEREGKAIDAVVDLDVDEEVLTTRIVYRLICEKCGQPYNTKTTMRPKVEGVCDRCGGALSHRADDTPETFAKRLEAYRAQTAPLLDYYSRRGCLRVFRNNNTAEETRRAMFDLIEGK